MKKGSKSTEISDYVGTSLHNALPSILALVLGILAGSILIAISGYDPIVVFMEMFGGALGSPQGQSYVMIYMAPFTMTALAFLIPGKAGIWNVGAQGQVYLGGITAALIALFVPLPPVLWPVVALLLAACVGALAAALPAVLEVYRNASAIVTTIMLNYVFAPLASYILFFVIAVSYPSTRISNMTPTFPQATWLPRIPGFTASILIFIAILLAVGTQLFLQRTTLGYNIRAVGQNATAAQMKGIGWKKVRIQAMIIGGLVAGLAGAGQVLGYYRGYVDQFAEGYFGGLGFAGIAVALVGASNPIGSLFSAFLFAVMVTGAPYIQGLGIPKELVWALQGIIILFAAMPYLYRVITKTNWSRAWRKTIVSPGKLEGH